ncbi:MAG TPA: urease accessory protein UreD [Burkholderiales bacterium]|jgi:urease accessory protein|nr:urease accessory protein UreD [Burkholderiales bacterium]
MKQAEAVALRTWDAALDLAYAMRCGRTVLARRSSRGPLAVQKSLYPEGDRVCHTIVLHPPGGIAGGDRLTITVNLQAGANALLTTPGATKWYRSAMLEAAQDVEIAAAAGAVCEWLPQENIFFNATNGRNAIAVSLEPAAVYCGWDVMCLGRAASGERFESGSVRQRLRVTRAGQPLFEELGTIEGGGALLDSPVGMAGFTVCGTFLLAGIEISKPSLDECRDAAPAGKARWGVTRMPDLLVARYLGSSAEEAREYFVRIWKIVRPLYSQRAMQIPRIWAT